MTDILWEFKIQIREGEIVMTIQELAKKCLNDFDEFRNNEATKKFVVDTMPILYFGDYEAYMKSDIKIITAAINPSDIEFKHKKDDAETGFFRFEKAAALKEKTVGELSAKDIQTYLDSLNDYFKPKPENKLKNENGGTDYAKWFRTEPRNLFLEHFDASYYEDLGKNRVLHTDIMTTIATNPTWTHNPKDKALRKEFKKAQRIFSEKGIDLWMELIEILQPDIIIFSVGKNYFKNTVFDGRFKTYKQYPVPGRKNPKTMYCTSFKLESEKTVYVFCEDRPLFKPFQQLGKEFASKFGNDIYRDYKKGALK